MSQAIVRTYPIVGGGVTEARFSILPDGTLHVELLMMLCRLWGPCKSLSFKPRKVDRFDVVDISYVDSRSVVCWTVTLYQENAADLKSVLPV